MTTNVTPVVLTPAVQLTTSATTYVVGAANSQTIIKRAVFTNTGTAAATITVYRVASGFIAAGGTDLAPELANMVLNAGGFISAMSDTAGTVNFFASGFVAN
jgi:hypothetical protein